MIHKLDETLACVCLNSVTLQSLKSLVPELYTLVTKAVVLAQNEILHFYVGAYINEFELDNDQELFSFRVTEPSEKYRPDEIIIAIWISDKSNRVIAEFPFTAGCDRSSLYIAEGRVMYKNQFVNTIRNGLRDRDYSDIDSLVPPFHYVAQQVVPLLQ